MLVTYIKPATFVLITVLLFGGGHLSSITLATIASSQLGVSDFGVGLLTSLTFFGLFIGSLVMPRLLARTKHVRLISLGTAGCALSLLFLPATDSLVIWSILRFGYGFSAAAVWLCCDVWMATHAPDEQRGRMLAFYQVVVLCGTSLGQMLLTTIGDHVALGFSIATATMIAAVIPISCTKLSEPDVETEGRKLTMRMAWNLSRLSLLGSLFVGLCFSNYGFILLSFTNQGATGNQIALLGVAIIASGILGQFGIGFLSDRSKDRRYLLQAVAALAATSLFICAISGIENWLPTIIFVCLYGGLVVTIYPLCVSLGSSLASKENFTPLVAKHFVAICIGHTLGPFLGGICLHFFPQFGTYIFICVTLVILIAACNSKYLLARHQPARQEEFAPMAAMGANPEYSDPRSMPDEVSDQHQADTPKSDNE